MGPPPTRSSLRGKVQGLIGVKVFWRHVSETGSCGIYEVEMSFLRTAELYLIGREAPSAGRELSVVSQGWFAIPQSELEEVTGHRAPSFFCFTCWNWI